MIERVIHRRPDWATVLGSGLVLVGLALFMIVFVVLFPVLTNPVGAYDRWFPDRATEPATEATSPPSTLPAAAFTWEAIAIESIEPPVYRVRFVDGSTSPAGDIEAWRWDFGDGTRADGRTVVHDYAEFGAYVVTLTIRDEAGETGVVAGEIAVPGVESAAGAAASVIDVAGSDIEATLEDAVGSVGDEISATIDTAFGSIGATVRGGVIVALFALAALAAIIVAWRVARIGVMILTRRSTSARSGRPDLDEADGLGERRFELV